MNRRKPRCVALLERWEHAKVRKPAVELELVEQEAEADHPVPDVDNPIPTRSRAAKRQKLDVLREKRKRKSKRSSSTAPQRLGPRFKFVPHKTEAVLGDVHLQYSYLGLAMSRRRAYDKICKNCVMKDFAHNPRDSHGTDTSSSSAIDGLMVQ